MWLMEMALGISIFLCSYSFILEYIIENDRSQWKEWSVKGWHAAKVLHTFNHEFLFSCPTIGWYQPCWYYLLVWIASLLKVGLGNFFILVPISQGYFYEYLTLRNIIFFFSFANEALNVETQAVIYNAHTKLSFSLTLEPSGVAV